MDLSIKTPQVYLREDLVGKLAKFQLGVLQRRLGAPLNRIDHHEPRRSYAPAQRAEILIEAGLEKTIGYRIELRLDRTEILLSNPVAHTLVRHLAVHGDQ